MHAKAATPLDVYEVREPDDIRTLQSIARLIWHPAADALDAWCSDRGRTDQRVVDSYCTTQQLARMLGRITENPTHFANYRIYCSADSDLQHITGIAIARLADERCTIEFAVSHPENIPVPGLQAKARKGSVAVIVHHLITSYAHYSAFFVEATASGLPFFERLGFTATSDTPSNRFLTPMTLAREKIRLLLPNLEFGYQRVELDRPLFGAPSANNSSLVYHY